MISTKHKKQRPGVLKPASIGVKTALIYGMLFVTLMLISRKTITADNLGLPAATLFLASNGGDYMERKSHNHFRQVYCHGILSVSGGLLHTHDVFG